MNTLRCAHEARNMCEPMSSFGPDARARVERGGQASWGPLRGPHQVEKIRSIRPRVLYYTSTEEVYREVYVFYLLHRSSSLRVRPRACVIITRLCLFLPYSFSLWLLDSCFLLSRRELFGVVIRRRSFEKSRVTRDMICR